MNWKNECIGLFDCGVATAKEVRYGNDKSKKHQVDLCCGN